MPRGKEVRLNEIVDLIDMKPYEVCGYKRHHKYVLTDKGQKQGNQNLCRWTKEYPVLWHTHFAGRPFWPSAQDLVKPLKKKIDTHIIFTTFQRERGNRYLKWTASCPQPPLPPRRQLQSIQDALRADMRHYFHDKRRGVVVRTDPETRKRVYEVSRDKGHATIKAFVKSVNRVMQRYAPRYTLKVGNMLA